MGDATRPERVVSSKRIFEGKKATLRIDTVELANGKPATREIIEHAAVGAIVAVDANGEVVLVRQYRLAAEEALLEIPAGVVDPGESPEECAQRELREETGMRAGKLTPLGGFYVSPGISTEFIHIFLGEELSEDSADADEDEDISLVRMSLAEAVRLIESGEIKDAKSVAGLLLLAKRQGVLR